MMARFRSMVVGLVNIKLHPHSPEKYERLIQSTFKIRSIGKIRGAEWGMIGSVNENNYDRNSPFLYGTIYKFLNIDPKAPWLDIKELNPLNTEDEKAFPLIPEELKPNLKFVSYVFYPKIHRIFFDTKIISASNMKTLLESMFKAEPIIRNFGSVDVCVESTKEAIEKIIAIPRLTKLDILYTKPNDDEFGSIEKKFLNRFDSLRIKRFEQTSTSMDYESIQIDDETKALMNIARNNGKVLAHGYDAEKRVLLSTEQHPMTEPVSYNPDKEGIFDVLAHSAMRLFKRLS